MFPLNFSCSVVLFCVGYFRFRLQDCYLLWFFFPEDSAGYFLFLHFGLFPVRSPLLGESSFLSFPQVTQMFQFTWFASYSYGLAIGYLYRGGFPHWEIYGSLDICSSPQLFAAYRVLLRLLVPRHSPSALFNLTFVNKHFCLFPV